MSRRSKFRITGGEFKGRPLFAPVDGNTRPMQGSLRELLFNVLRPELDGAHVLDLFSGTGSVGLEAISRGAACCTFFEKHRPARRILEKNINLLGCGPSTAILSLDLLRLSEFPETPHAPYDIIFLDPPFRFQDPGSEEDILPLVHLLLEKGTVAPGAVLVYQLRKRQFPPENLHSFRLEKEKQPGSVRLIFYRESGNLEDTPPEPVS
jgi:16S rRNA (guanine966-N2)-methyltransferase